MKGFSVTRGINIFSIRSDNYILAERFCHHQIKYYFKVNLLLKNSGYNNKSVQNQNVFLPSVRNIWNISSVNIKLSNESIP